MSRRMLLISLWLAILGPMPASAADNSLLGTRRLRSFVREVSGTGERYNQMGDHPDGYISYSSDGRMLAFFVSADQPRPHAEPTDDERIKLHKSMLAYGGTCRKIGAASNGNPRPVTPDMIAATNTPNAIIPSCMGRPT
jgi:hypothetical protein